ncbi:MAG: CocE/NonD family hydrolase [Acidobacteriota bacterium]
MRISPSFRVAMGAMAVYLGVAPSLGAQNWECRQVMVPMRDGVRLATDVYLPQGQGSGPFPVVIERTPYDKGDCRNPHAEYFAARGYVAMVQDERGRYESEGEYYWLMDEGWGERRDGYDTIEWAAHQPYSTGKIGTMGLSFTCANQLLTAPTRPPHLVAMFCAEYAANSYRDVFWPGGALHMVIPAWLLTQGEMVKPLRENVPGHRGYLGSGEAWKRWYDEHVGSGESFTESMFSRMYRDLLGNPYYNDYWRRLAVDEHWQEIDVPIYHLGGWYDRHIHGTVRHFNGIREKGASRARGAQKLIVGPWTHGTARLSNPRVGAMTFPGSTIDYDALRLRWFDYHLKGIDNGIIDDPPVRIYVMGESAWRDELEFPLKRQVETSFYLRAGPSGSIDSLNDGLLLLEKPGDETPDRYAYDPARPVPTLGGDLFVEPEGAQDHRPADRRSLTYTTPPLEEDLEITGFSRVEFFASSTAVDTDWVVTLIDVHPSGYAQHLRQNLLRARYRDGDEAPTLMEPGTIYPFTIEIYPLSNLFKKGHRIRLSVTSSSFPKWYPNGNTGREILEDRPGIVATNTIYHDSDHPSRLVVPVIPRP